MVKPWRKQNLKQQEEIAKRARTEIIEVACRLVVAAALWEHRVEAELISLAVQALQQKATKNVVAQHNLQDREKDINRNLETNELVHTCPGSS